jgi:anti-sigma B factor antagonist
MFSISVNENQEVLLVGRLDASQTEQAAAVLDKLSTTTRVNFKDLEYISSAGLGILLKTQKRLTASGNKIILTNMNKLIRDIFHIARFDLIFQIEP